MMATARKSVDAPQLLGGTAIKPVERHGWEAVRYFLHNPETGAFLSRTPKSWLLIFLFYVIYYTCLAGFWYGMLQVFFLSLNDDTPKWVREESIIGVNPGMGVRPRQADPRIDSSMYALEGNYRETLDLEEDSAGGFALRMKDYLKRYDNQTDAVDCSVEDLDRPRGDKQKPCRFDPAAFGECSRHPYGFDDKKPCVIVKLNKIFGLVPAALQPDDDLSEDIPENLRARIQNPTESRRVYIECHGENPADVEALKGKIRYFPEHQGIPMGYFPHQDKSNKVSPAVAIKFDALPPGQLLHVECRAWFKGVVHARKERMGLVHFELFAK